ncbi:hypothetical protein Acr_00g0015730 [Actinidia rufa]|uniref:Cupin type-1 domain-containing protein n=1 Tax=Actinidia rufa TaxID=165716 RepID=A0A7J0DCH9_9ERIC|nr:hypothetical protein Acr_00g0015730 [Actinidia rufa]
MPRISLPQFLLWAAQALELCWLTSPPKGVVHFQYNSDAKHPAAAVSAFGSASAGTVLVPITVSVPSIDDGILA